MRSRKLPIVLGAILAALIVAGVVYFKLVTSQKLAGPSGNDSLRVEAVASPLAPASPVAATAGAPSAAASGAPEMVSSSSSPSNPAAAPDLTVDTNGLSKTTVSIKTEHGTIKFKFYPKDAPNTVNRIIELIQKGFYNGLIFHRVVEGFVIQGGDPMGNGTGGSGQKLKAEFNNRRHIEGTVAMARAMDPDSADSQFYISLGTLPHLDRNYTVFGQVIEGMDVAKKIKAGDKMVSVTLE